VSEKKEYIERGAFIDYIDAGHLRYATEVCFSENDVVSMINKQPAAPVEPIVLATWIEAKAITGSFLGYYHCSACEKANLTNGDREYLSPRCPHCGAIMSNSEEMERSGSGE